MRVLDLDFVGRYGIEKARASALACLAILDKVIK